MKSSVGDSANVEKNVCSETKTEVFNHFLENTTPTLKHGGGSIVFHHEDGPKKKVSNCYDKT